MLFYMLPDIVFEHFFKLSSACILSAQAVFKSANASSTEGRLSSMIFST